MDANNHLSAFDLDLLSLGSLPASEASRLSSHLHTCARCAEEHQRRQADAQEFRGAVGPRTTPQIVRRLSRRWPRPAFWIGALVPATAALALFITRPAPPPPPPAPPEPDVAIKGAAWMKVFAKRAGQVFAVPEGSALRAGDELRLSVGPSRAPYLLVASVDGVGHASVYFPFGGTQSERVDPTRPFDPPASIILDAAPGPERIFALWSDAPLAAAEVLAALRSLGAGGPNVVRAAARLRLPARDQVSFLFEKPATR